MQYQYRTHGTCSREIQFELEDGIIKEIEFNGGCDGNLKGISALAKGRRIEEVIDLFKGMTCGYKATSCPDQLAIALEVAQKQIN